MAKITPIDIIKGVSGKFGGGNSKEYFATNKCSYRIHLAKRVNEFQGPATEKQLEVRARFKSKQNAVRAWLRANRATKNRPATEAYLMALALKRRYGFSNINQVVYKYLNDDLQVVLPDINSDAEDEAPSPAPSQPSNKPQGGAASGDNKGDSSGDSQPQPSGKKTLTLVANPAEGGSFKGAGTYDAGTEVSVEALANDGYEFSEWSDGDNFPTRKVTMNEDVTFTAIFKPVQNTEQGANQNTDQNTDEGGLGA